MSDTVLDTSNDATTNSIANDIVAAATNNANSSYYSDISHNNYATTTNNNASISSDSQAQVPGTYPPEWLPDHDADSCMSCDINFTLIKRRHHCRSCGKIFCSDCCRQRAKLFYLGNKEARVCCNCYYIIQCAQIQSTESNNTNSSINLNLDESDNSISNADTSSNPRVQGVLKTTEQNRDTSSMSTPDNQQVNKQVMFSDGIRPGTDLSETCSFPILPSSSNSTSTLTRQSKNANSHNSSLPSKKSRNSKSNNLITVCDELGYLPPIVLNRSSIELKELESSIPELQITNLDSKSKVKSLDGMVAFEKFLGIIGNDGILTFLLLKDFYLKVKLVTQEHDKSNKQYDELTSSNSQQTTKSNNQFWCFASDGLSRLGQSEIVLVLDRDDDASSIPRDVFKIYLTIHELALRRQSLENLGNLLFQDGLFDNRDTAGLLLVRHMDCQDLSKFVLPESSFLFALVLQRWEVPWSKVFPVRLLLRLGHKLGQYPYPLVSYRVRSPVYYEVGHTIISILGDFRNFRYSITHVEGLKVMIIKSEKRVLVQLNQSCYQQFNKVLDSSSNEHVLAWSSYPFEEADGHLVSVQNDDGQYETVEFYKAISDPMISFENMEMNNIMGASFVIFSGALKANQSGRSAKISIVEDGLLIQLQSCTMSALKQAINCMHEFDIDCGEYNLKLSNVATKHLISTQAIHTNHYLRSQILPIKSEDDRDNLNRVNISWLPEVEK